MTQVELVNLSKRYDGSGDAAVRELSLSIPAGQITALLGPSGCGKTTTLKMVAGLLHPTGGDIRFDGRSVLALPAERRGAAMVFQNHLLFPFLSVEENVAFGLRMRGVGRAEVRQRVGTMLERVRLPGFGARRPKELSGGQQQRVALARALVIEPQVLLLDEPLSNLDAHLRDEMRELIRTLQRQLGITTLFVTHDQGEAIVLADQVAVLFGGQLHQADAPRAFFERPATEAVARFFGWTNFVPGQKRGPDVATAFGTLRGAPCHLPDGPVTLTIRPEALRLGASDATPNVVPATIRSHLYAGTHTRFRVEAAGHPLEVVADASSPWQVGETVPLRFPAEHLWLLPREG